MEGKIYKIIDNTNNNIYIGSTTLDLNERLNNHKKSYTQYKKNNKYYTTAYEIIKNNNYKIELLLECKINDIKELRKIEGDMIKKNQCINKRIEGSTREESLKRHQEKFRDRILERSKNYYYNNIEELKQYKNVKFICQCGGKYTRTNKATHLKTNKHLSIINNNNLVASSSSA